MNQDLAAALATVGRQVRDAVLAVPATAADADVVRVEGGDAVFGVDARADVVLVEALRRRCGEQWPGRLIIEGLDEPAAIGEPSGEWVYIADPVDGTRPWLAGKRSAWILLGAGRGARTRLGWLRQRSRGHPPAASRLLARPPPAYSRLVGRVAHPRRGGVQEVLADREAALEDVAEQLLACEHAGQ
jgi:fructose-1,6-bisphosphatase/inositol monophosphatase family enzyme